MGHPQTAARARPASASSGAGDNSVCKGSGGDAWYDGGISCWPFLFRMTRFLNPKLVRMNINDIHVVKKTRFFIPGTRDSLIGFCTFGGLLKMLNMLEMNNLLCEYFV